MIVATAGHVDHGKTSLVQAITGVDADRLGEEKARGLTIDLGFAYTDIDNLRLGFVDVPGHIRFIDNMLAGIPAVDHALIVIAADDGPMPQTHEHIAILDLLRIESATVAVTKIDRVDAERVAEVMRKTKSLLRASRLQSAEILAVSSITGEGVDNVIRALIKHAPSRDSRESDAPFRLAIDRAFNLKGTGLIVTGSVFTGTVAVGDELWLLPHREKVRVRSLHRQDETAGQAFTGDRCALNVVTDVAKDEIHRGNWIVARPIPVTRHADIALDWRGEHGIKPGTNVHVHTGANHVMGRLSPLSPSAAPPDHHLARLSLSEPINLWRHDRLIVRDSAAQATIAGGYVLDPSPPGSRPSRDRAARLTQLEALEAETLTERLRRSIDAAKDGLDVEKFAAAENIDAAELGSLLSTPGVIRHGNLLFPEQVVKNAEAAVEREIRARIAADPSTDGVQLDAIDKSIPEPLVMAAVDHLIREGRLSQSGNRYMPPDFNPELPVDAKELLERAAPLLRESPMRPPVVHDLAASLDISPAEIDRLLSTCAQLGHVVKATPNRFYVPEGITALKDAARETAQRSPDGQFEAREYRDTTGIGRNLAIEILEYFDTLGFTVRLGNKRKLKE